MAVSTSVYPLLNICELPSGLTAHARKPSIVPLGDWLLVSPSLNWPVYRHEKKQMFHIMFFRRSREGRGTKKKKANHITSLVPLHQPESWDSYFFGKPGNGSCITGKLVYVHTLFFCCSPRVCIDTYKISLTRCRSDAGDAYVTRQNNIVLHLLKSTTTVLVIPNSRFLVSTFHFSSVFNAASTVLTDSSTLSQLIKTTN